MIAYNTQWLDALRARRSADKWYKEQLIDADTRDRIYQAYPEQFYIPNLFIRLGLTAFTFLIIVMLMIFIGVIIDPSWRETTILVFMFGLLLVALLELWVIPGLRHLGSGLDNVFSYVGYACIYYSVYDWLPDGSDSLSDTLLALPFLVVGALRYLDGLFLLGLKYCSLVILILFFEKNPAVGVYVLPLAGMAFCGLWYFYCQGVQKRYDRRHWHGLATWGEVLGLAGFYACGNYFMVQNILTGLFGAETPPMGWLYWICTFVVPVAYIISGFRSKDRLMLDLGMLALVAGLLTFRFYHSILPLEWVATLGGAALFGLAYLGIYRLRHHPGGYTYAQLDKPSMLQEVEEQLIEQTIGAPAAAKKDNPTPMGGGQFGGGGAGADF
jgi:hypothetical protein